ncbi:hypothetical protein [Sulfurimonas microaerophilic]|uniref:hypothetical protein n=1 Tax=Sulfurimonas microaerophilic TaxID=3058392 RepID=UPI0027147DF8|nr:hypothetical protein [Sulfurimonas sp. hsl 1-7]
MYVKTVLLSIFIFFTSCSSFHINSHNNQIQLLDDKSVVLDYSAQLLYKAELKLTNIRIGQKVYKLDTKAILTTEELYAATGYQFDGSVANIVGTGFSNHIYTKEFSKGDMSFFTLKSKNGKLSNLYLIVENQNKKRIKLFYGTDKEFYYKVLDLISNGTLNSKLYNKQSLADVYSNPKLYIDTTWSEKNIILDQLLKNSSGYIPRLSK